MVQKAPEGKTGRVRPQRLGVSKISTLYELVLPHVSFSFDVGQSGTSKYTL